jgi:hypothetical protein
MIDEKIKENGHKIEIISLFILVVTLAIFFSYLTVFVNSAGGVGGNVTVDTLLEVGSVYPEVLNVSIMNDATSATLTPNATRTIDCLAYIRDWNNDSDFSNVYAEFFDTNYGASNDNNHHYTNYSCFINRSFATFRGFTDTNYTAFSNCTFEVEYYADPVSWNCTVVVNDTMNWNASNSDTINISELLAVGLPESINYGTVNATYVSSEIPTNVTNFGNVRINLSLDGFARNRSDNFSMNCSLGSVMNISIYYERFNLSASNPGTLTLSAFDNGNYTNLTGTPTVKTFNLYYRQDDIVNDAINTTYWRIYVPVGVAGSCRGNIVFGAVKVAAT